MNDWICSFVSQNLHEAAPLDTFPERLRRRLQATPESLSGGCPEAVITKTVGDLIHDLNRTAIRREIRSITGAVEFEELPDPGQNIESILIEQVRQEQALAVLQSLKTSDRELVEKIYGIHRGIVNRKEIAKELGVQRNTIDQRLKRIIEYVRKAL